MVLKRQRKQQPNLKILKRVRPTGAAAAAKRTGPGQPSRREKLAQRMQEATGATAELAAKMVGACDVDAIYSLTDEEAEAELIRLLNPAHLNLMIARSLQRIVAEGGKAGSDAARLLQLMQKDWAPASKRSTLVSFQVAG